MRTVAMALTFARRMIGRRSVHIMLAGFNRSAVNAE